MYLPAGELSRAVLIGTSDFLHPDLPRLPAVANNLSALFRALTDQDTGILPAQNCRIVQSPDSPETFMQWLRASAYEAEDLLLVYYAGHGLRHERRDDLYLAVSRTDPNGLDGSAVQFDWVRELIADSPANAKLLILDCCYSGLALDRMSATAVDSRELAVSGTSVLASSPRNKQSHSPKDERYTAFTGELVSLLVDGPPLAAMPLTVHNVFLSVKARLFRRGLPLPTLRSDDTSGQVLLRRRPESPTGHDFTPPQAASPDEQRRGRADRNDLARRHFRSGGDHRRCGREHLRARRQHGERYRPRGDRAWRRSRGSLAVQGQVPAAHLASSPGVLACLRKAPDACARPARGTVPACRDWRNSGRSCFNGQDVVVQRPRSHYSDRGHPVRMERDLRVGGRATPDSQALGRL